MIKNENTNAVTLTPEIIDYFNELLGTETAKRLIWAIKNNAPIFVTGPRITTGKTTLVDVLRAIGYERIKEEWEVITIPVYEPLPHLREKADIFEELGIEMKR